jgi:signal transduction histidine kinase
MDKKLVPAHVLFAKWFIRIRWFAILILVVSVYVLKNCFDISIMDIHIYIISGILLLLNGLHTFILRKIVKNTSGRVLEMIKNEIHFQIISDLIILTLILHFSGGIENPVLIFYFFHLIIASSIFTSIQSYLHAVFALLLLATLTYLEYYGIIPHYHIEGFVSADLYKNSFFIFGAGIIYVFTSILLVSLTHMIFTRSIKIEETYVVTNLELEKKDKLQNEYVLHVTHDIKGHLAAILSCLKLLSTKILGSLNEKQEEFVNRAYDRTEVLANFVRDLLNLSKKRLQQDAEFEEFSLKDLVTKVVTSVQILAKDKTIDLNVSVDNAINNIIGNQYTIEELYSNLLLNAIKYTPSGGHIELIVRNRLDHVITEISDSGIGIPKDEIPKVFNEFYRAKNVPKDVGSGTGLGLSIVKQIVENHKGRIWVSSELGVWTKFYFTLPKNPDAYDPAEKFKFTT